MTKVFEHFLDRSLAHVVRFNSRPQQFPESVAEHTFFVAYFTSVILHFLKKAGETVDEAKVLKMALVHDMEEVFSGDILKPFKHFNEEILAAIQNVSRQAIPMVFEDLPPDLSSEFVALWNEESKQESKEAQVVKLADKISLMAKCYEEMKIGNDFFRPIYEREMEKLKAFDRPWWLKIKKEVLGE